jgi:hypothetical protein
MNIIDMLYNVKHSEEHKLTAVAALEAQFWVSLSFEAQAMR